jgi:WD40 repeat protein
MDTKSTQSVIIASAEPEVTPETPWLGLRSFTKSVNPYFFGRDREVQELVERINHCTLTILYGQSGLGKTSLLEAGVLTELIEVGYRPVLVRLIHDPEIESMSLEKQVIREIYKEVVDEDAPIPENVSSLWELFHNPEFGFAKRREDDTDRVVLIFDQFEEMFTLGAAKGPSKAQAFFESLSCLVENRPPKSIRNRLEQDKEFARKLFMSSQPCKVVLSLRDDFLNQLERWRKQMPSMMENRFELRNLTGPQALEAVYRPGKVRCIGSNLPPIVSRETAKSIVRFVAKKDHSVPIEDVENVPPLLSLICEQLNARRIKDKATTLDSEKIEDSSDDVLFEFCADCFRPHPPAVREFVEQQLISQSGYREAKTLDAAVYELKSQEVDEPENVLAQLVKSRLLVGEDRGGVSRVELTHDVLAPVIVKMRDQGMSKKALKRVDKIYNTLGAEDDRIRLQAIARRMFRSLSARDANRSPIRRRLSIEEIALESGVPEEDILFVGAAFQKENVLFATTNEPQWSGKTRLEISHKSLFHSWKSLREWMDLEADAEAEYRHLLRDIDAGIKTIEGTRLNGALRWLKIFEPTDSWAMRYDGAKTPEESRLSECKELITRSVRAKKEAKRRKEIADQKKIEEQAKALKQAEELADTQLKWWNAEKKKNRMFRTALFAVGFAGVVATGLFLDARGSKNEALKLKFEAEEATKIAEGALDDAENAQSETTKALEEAEKAKSDALEEKKTADEAKLIAENALVDAEKAQNDTTKALEEAEKAKSDALEEKKTADEAKLIAENALVDAEKAQNDTTKALEEAEEAKSAALDEKIIADDARALANSAAIEAEIARNETQLLAAKLILQNGHTTIRYENDVIHGMLRYAVALENVELDEEMRTFTRMLTTGWSRALPKFSIVHDSPVYDMKISNDDKIIATLGYGGTWKLWDVSRATPNLIEIENVSEMIHSLDFSPDGKLVAVATIDNTVRFLDSSTWAIIHELAGPNDFVSELVFSPDGRLLATGDYDNNVILWDTTTGKKVGDLGDMDGWLNSIVFSHDGSVLATGNDDGTVRIWDISDFKPVGELLKHPVWVHEMLFTSDGRTLATKTGDGKLRLWNLSSHKSRLLSENISMMTISPDGIRLAGLTFDGKLKLWKLPDAELEAEWSTHDDAVSTLVFSPDGQSIATGSYDETVRFWLVPSGASIRGPFKHSGAVTKLTFARDGRRLATASSDKTVRIWDVRASQPPGKNLSLNSSVGGTTTSNDGRVLMTLDDGKKATLWDTSSGERIGDGLEHDNELFGPVFSPDSRFLATVNADNQGTITSTGTGESTSVLNHSDPLTGLAFSPNSERVATVSLDKKARIWDTTTGDLIGTEIEHGGRVPAIRFSSSGRILGTRGSDKNVALWDTDDGQLIGSKLEHTGRIVEMLFDPTDRVLATKTADNKLWLWDLQKRDIVPAPLDIHARIEKMLFSSDGEKIVCFDSVGAVHIFDTRESKLLGRSYFYGGTDVEAAFGQDDKSLVIWSSYDFASLVDVTASEFSAEQLYQAGTIDRLVFSDDRETFAAGSVDGKVTLWNARSGEPKGRLLGHRGSISALAFSRDGQLLATGGGGGDTRLWDVESGTPIGAPFNRGGGNNEIAFSADNRSLIASGGGNAVWLWEVPAPADKDLERVRLSIEVRSGRFIANGLERTLSQDEWLERKNRLDVLGGDNLDRTWADFTNEESEDSQNRE